MILILPYSWPSHWKRRPAWWGLCLYSRRGGNLLRGGGCLLGSDLPGRSSRIGRSLLRRRGLLRGLETGLLERIGELKATLDRAKLALIGELIEHISGYLLAGFLGYSVVGADVLADSGHG